MRERSVYNLAKVGLNKIFGCVGTMHMRAGETGVRNFPAQRHLPPKHLGPEFLGLMNRIVPPCTERIPSMSQLLGVFDVA